jgi:hypothetical protein
MKDYQAIWIKWEALLSSDIKERKDLLDNLNIEVKKGFDVIVRIATEEIISQSNNKFVNIKEELEKNLAILAFAGYLLYLVQSGTDPKEANLVAKTSTSELGTVWMESFEKDKGIGYVEQLDPVFSLLLDSRKQSCIDSLMNKEKELPQLSYQLIHMMELYFLWTAQQGYIFGIIENELSSTS